MKILLAEDEAQVRHELTELLSEEGHEMCTAADGIEAFEKFRDDEAVDLLLLDIRMPRCTGLQTLDAINKLNVEKDRIYEAIFITGNNESEAIISALKLGAFSFLFKPLVVEDLLREVGEATDRINQRRYRRFQQATLEAQVESKSLQILRMNDEMKGGMGAAFSLAAMAAEHYAPGIDMHIHRIAEMSAALAQRMGFERVHCQQLRLASMLHDIGKLDKNAELYNAERKLTAEEFEITKTHTSHGDTILSSYDDPVFKMARKIAAQHHENHDGTGYPLGLAGGDIAIEAAIVHVADVYDNLRAPRPYREELPHYRAVDILINGDEKSTPDHFNPDVLQALLGQHREIEAIYERYKPAVVRSL